MHTVYSSLQQDCNAIQLFILHLKYERLHRLQHSCASYTAALLCVAVMACCMEPSHSKRNSRLHWRPAQVSKQVQCQCPHVLIASTACQKFHVHQEIRKACQQTLTAFSQMLCHADKRCAFPHRGPSNEATTKVQWNRSCAMWGHLAEHFS